jgi:hypothetical protein
MSEVSSAAGRKAGGVLLCGDVRFPPIADIRPRTKRNDGRGAAVPAWNKGAAYLRAILLNVRQRLPARFGGVFAELEDELAGLTIGGGCEGPGRTPDRADAMVWAMTELMLGKMQAEPRV